MIFYLKFTSVGEAHMSLVLHKSGSRYSWSVHGWFGQYVYCFIFNIFYRCKESTPKYQINNLNGNNKIIGLYILLPPALLREPVLEALEVVEIPEEEGDETLDEEEDDIAEEEGDGEVKLDWDDSLTKKLRGESALGEVGGEPGENDDREVEEAEVDRGGDLEEVLEGEDWLIGIFEEVREDDTIWGE